MSVGRWYRAYGTGTGASGKGRWYRARATGTEAASGKGRWFRFLLAGPGSILVQPFSEHNKSVLPDTPVTITAQLDDGTPADSTTWTQIAGPTAAISGTGMTRTIIPASYMVANVSTASVVTFTVTATVDGTTSLAREFSLNIPPQTFWMRKPGGSWVGVGAPRFTDEVQGVLP